MALVVSMPTLYFSSCHQSLAFVSGIQPTSGSKSDSCGIRYGNTDTRAPVSECNCVRSFGQKTVINSQIGHDIISMGAQTRGSRDQHATFEEFFLKPVGTYEEGMMIITIVNFFESENRKLKFEKKNKNTLF